MASVSVADERVMCEFIKSRRDRTKATVLTDPPPRPTPPETLPPAALPVPLCIEPECDIRVHPYPCLDLYPYAVCLCNVEHADLLGASPDDRPGQLLGLPRRRRQARREHDQHERDCDEQGEEDVAECEEVGFEVRWLCWRLDGDASRG